MGYLILFLESIIIIVCLFGLYISAPLCSKNHYSPQYTILLVRNSEDYIEGIVRNLTKTFENSTNYAVNYKLLIIDFGSSDNTLNILERLAKNYEFIEILYAPKIPRTK